MHAGILALPQLLHECVRRGPVPRGGRCWDGPRRDLGTALSLPEPAGGSLLHGPRPGFAEPWGKQSADGTRSRAGEVPAGGTAPSWALPGCVGLRGVAASWHGTGAGGPHLAFPCSPERSSRWKQSLLPAVWEHHAHVSRTPPGFPKFSRLCAGPGPPRSGSSSPITQPECPDAELCD